MNAGDQAYFLRRMLQEEEAANGASCLEARQRHEELAIVYRARCLGTSADGRAVPDILHDVTRAA